MLNRVILIGRMTRDPELRKTTSGLSVLSFRIAVDDNRKGPNGEKQTLFIGCSVFGQRAETVSKFTHKGSLVGVDGRLQQRTYTDRNGNNVTTTEVVCDSVEFLDPKGAKVGDSGYESDMPSAPRQTSPRPAPSQEPSLDDGFDIKDDDMPF